MRAFIADLQEMYKDGWEDVETSSHLFIVVIVDKRCAKMIPYLLELPFCIRSAFAFICASGTT